MRLFAITFLALVILPTSVLTDESAAAGQLDNFDPSAPPTIIQTAPPKTTEQLIQEQNTLIRQQNDTLRRIEQQGERQPLRPCAPGQVGCRIR